jgi:hypothetical protein
LGCSFEEIKQILEVLDPHSDYTQLVLKTVLLSWPTLEEEMQRDRANASELYEILLDLA